MIDLTANLIRLLYTRGYGERLHYDRAELREIYALAQRYPVVFLPTHRSNLDHLGVSLREELQLAISAAGMRSRSAGIAVTSLR